MVSQAAQQVKLGFWVAVGFWIFAIVMCIILLLILGSFSS
jgi:hypothetical protein